LSAPLDAPVRAGLAAVEALQPGHGFAELLAGARGDGSETAAFARGEVGVKFAPQGSAFAFGEALLGRQGPSWQAGVGAKWVF
jgi:hypothetical protein